MSDKKKGRQGLASVDKKKRVAIARLGGKARNQKDNPGNFANNPELAKRAGSKGGSVTKEEREARRREAEHQ